MTSADLEAGIRERAYALWEAAGRPEGCDLEHWLQAETMVGETVVGETVVVDAAAPAKPKRAKKTETAAEPKPAKAKKAKVAA